MHSVLRRIVEVIGLAAVVSQVGVAPPDVLPAAASTQLSRSLQDSRPHPRSVWRDTPPINADGTVTGYIEIARGDRRKWEFNMRGTRARSTA